MIFFISPVVFQWLHNYQLNEGTDHSPVFMAVWAEAVIWLIQHPNSSCLSLSFQQWWPCGCPVYPTEVWVYITGTVTFPSDATGGGLGAGVTAAAQPKKEGSPQA